MVTNKKLIIMRGLPGSGKSEKAKQLVEDGIIHSTDNYFVQDGVYKFDENNICRFHDLNLMSSIESMKKGVSPIIIDNTNLISFYCEDYVENAKIYGYEIVVVEPESSWAFDVDELVKRNVHNTSRDVILAMLKMYEDPEVFKRRLEL